MFGIKTVLDKYKLYGAYHWRWYGRRLTYTRHVDFLKRWVGERNTLQIGAGDGLIVAKLGIKGVDNNLYAHKLAMNRRVKVDCIKGNRLPYEKGQFDSALISDNLASFKNLTQALNETKRVITKYLYIATGIGNKPVYGPGTYHQWKTPQKLISEVQKNGFKLVGDPIYKVDRKRYYFKFEKA